MSRSGLSRQKNNVPATDSPACTPNKDRSAVMSEDSKSKALDQRLKEQSDYIIQLLSKHIIESEKRISTNITNQINDLKHSIENTQTKVNELELELNSAKANIVSLNSELLDLKNALSDIGKQSSNAINELNSIKQIQSVQDNRKVACDALLSGVPHIPQENLKSIFNLLCTALQIKPPTISNIYRLPSKLNHDSKDTQIIVKFNSPYERNFVLKSIASFRKQNQREMCLLDININSNKFIYMREALTKTNYNIFQRAMGLKKQKQISSVFTSRGIVYVKRKHNESAEPIECMEDLTRDVNSTK